MQIKRFQAPTLIEAVQQVKAALGPDALVLSTRTLRKGDGWFGLAGRPVVEVTAALDREAAASSRRSEAASVSPSASPAASDSTGALVDEVRALRASVRALRSAEAHGDETLRELAALRTLTAELARGQTPEGGGPLESRLAGRLLASGLAPNHAWRLGREAALRPDVGRAEREALLATLRERFDDRMPPPRSDDGVEVELWVGPTGAGKTTTLAKLAAREAREGGDVALLTTDVHRVGAVEPLRGYAAAIGVPFAVAPGAEALAERIRERPARRVLVDTAGCSGEGLGELGALREAVGERARVGLVLAATADADQLRFERARYAALAPDALILTKLDECASWASAANLLLDEPGPPLQWTATGQRVPEDLTVPEPAVFAEALLGGARAS